MKPLPSTVGDTLAAVEGALAVRRAADAELFVLAAHWADQHPAETLYGVPVGLPGRERVVMLGGEGTPEVAEFAAAELGVSLHQHPHAARNLIADALDIRHRFPGLWHLLTDELALEVWVARKIAATTRALSQRQAAEIDDRLVEVAASLPPSRLLRVVEAMVLAADDTAADAAREAALKRRFVTINQATEHGTKGLYAKLDAADAIRLDAEVDRLARILAKRGDQSTLDVRRSAALGWLANPAAALQLIAESEPEGLDADLATTLTKIDPRHLRPRVELVVHLTESDFTRDARGVARFEGGGRSGPITLAHAREILGHAHVTIRPVIDLAHQLPADGYEFTGTLREAAFLATPVDCFPYAVSTSRRMQLDHTIPYDENGPPGQTRLDNAGPLTQRHHRIATHGRWRKKQPLQGVYAWRTPHGRYRITNHTGTHTLQPALGKGLFDGTPAEQQFITHLLPTLTGAGVPRHRCGQGQAPRPAAEDGRGAPSPPATAAGPQSG